MKLILASASPRRAELLRAAGFPFDVLPADVDETLTADESPESYVRRLAVAKGAAVASVAGQRPVLAADTIVTIDGHILGKPTGAADAIRMLRLLSGRTHEVITGVSLTWESVPYVDVARTAVEFAPLADAELEWYVASGEGLDKAGSYAIQGLASRFVTRIDGSYSNVVGLPVALVYSLCTNAGLLVS